MGLYGISGVKGLYGVTGLYGALWGQSALWGQWGLIGSMGPYRVNGARWALWDQSTLWAQWASSAHTQHGGGAVPSAGSPAPLLPPEVDPSMDTGGQRGALSSAHPIDVWG